MCDAINTLFVTLAYSSSRFRGYMLRLNFVKQIRVLAVSCQMSKIFQWNKKTVFFWRRFSSARLVHACLGGLLGRQWADRVLAGCWDCNEKPRRRVDNEAITYTSRFLYIRFFDNDSFAFCFLLDATHGDNNEATASRRWSHRAAAARASWTKHSCWSLQYLLHAKLSSAWM